MSWLTNFRHPKVQAVRLAGDPDAPILPEHMTLDQLRESIIVDLERLRDAGVLDRGSPSIPTRNCAARSRSRCRGR
jgi:hypothetical protein